MTDLGRCFRCQRKFNHLDIAMVAKPCTFCEAVQILLESVEETCRARRHR